MNRGRDHIPERCARAIAAGVVLEGLNTRDEMLTIDEPGWHIENLYDAAGRVARQVTRYPDSDAADTIGFDDTVSDGAVSQTNITEYDGTLTRHTYNRRHYLLTQIFDADGPHPISVSYKRSESTNLTSAVSIRCDGRDGPVDDTVPVRSSAEHASIASAIARACR